MDRIAVIGGGIGGLSAAVCLASQGYHVDLFEKGSGPGGKAGTFSDKGFTFDTGPSLLTLPFVFEELIERAGLDPDELLPVIRQDVICKYFFPDGTVFTAYSDRDKLLDEFCSVMGEDREVLKTFFAHCASIYDNAKDIFLFDIPDKVPELFKSDPLRGMRIISSLDIFRSLHSSHVKYFKDPRTIQLFDRYATYSGSDPYKMPATFNIVPHVEYDIGAYVPTGGIRAIPHALRVAGEKLGVRFNWDSLVDSIDCPNGRVRGLTVNGEEKGYGAIVSNSDVMNTYDILLSDTDSSMARRYCKAEPSSSAVVFYWGVKGRRQYLDVNNIIFSGDYRKEFIRIFDRKLCPEDPTIYINISCKYKEDDAPEGCENWFVLVNVPYDTGQDWPSETTALREIVLNTIEDRFGESIRGNILTERVMTPMTIRENTFSNAGSIYGISSNSRMAAYYRQPNASRVHRGLYFAGGSAHPGGGMPLVALSGKLAAGLVKRDLGGKDGF